MNTEKTQVENLFCDVFFCVTFAMLTGYDSLTVTVANLTAFGQFRIFFLAIVIASTFDQRFRDVNQVFGAQ